MMNFFYNQTIKQMKWALRHQQKSYLRFSNFPTLVTVTGLSCVAFALSPSISSTAKGQIPYISSCISFLRSMKIGLIISFDYTFAKLGLNESSPNYNLMMSRIHQRAADRLLNGCLLNGGTYIKLGQGLCAMNHILPVEYTTTLKQLQHKCLSRKVDEVRTLFLQDFGKTPDDMFKNFDNEPIAAASVAQVFEATTQNNEKVAVKVQYIDLQNRFNGDIATLELIMGIIGFLHPNFNFKWILEELKGALHQELDFIHEGKNAERCASDLHHLNYVYVPKIYWNLCSSRVLVTEFIDGYKISDVDKLINDGFDLVDINKKLFETFGEQIFQTGFVHADPHPGNVLVRRKGNKTQLVLLDHGLYENISENERTLLSHLWKAIVLNDHPNMKKYSNELGVEDYVMFAEILTQIPLKIKNFKLTTKLTEEDLKLMREFAANRMDMVLNVLKHMPSSLLLILRNLNTIRSIAQEHGNPIDRYEALARCATKRAFANSRNIFTKVRAIPIKIYFEFKITKNKLFLWFQKIILQILQFLGRTGDLKFLTDKMG